MRLALAGTAPFLAPGTEAGVRGDAWDPVVQIGRQTAGSVCTIRITVSPDRAGEEGLGADQQAWRDLRTGIAQSPELRA